MKTNEHGGARKGAGRRPSKNSLASTICVRVTEQQKERWNKLGGAEWLRVMLAASKQEGLA